MKKWILLIWLFCVQLLAVHAENEYYTIFKVGSNICTPVTLKTPYGNYTIHTEITIPNSLSWFEAFDCEGKKIMDTGGKVSVGPGIPPVRIYYLTTLFPHADNETPRSDNESYTPSTRNSFSNPEWTEKTAEALVDLTEAKGWNHESHSIYLEAGYGFAYGNAGIRLKYISPVVFGLTASFGYNTQYKPERIDDKQYLWNVGVQLHLSKFLAIGMYGGPQYFSKYNKSEIGFGAMLEYSHQIYKRLGITGGVGFVIAAEEASKNPQTLFAFHAGISYNLFSN